MKNAFISSLFLYWVNYVSLNFFPILKVCFPSLFKLFFPQATPRRAFPFSKPAPSRRNWLMLWKQFLPSTLVGLPARQGLPLTFRIGCLVRGSAPFVR